MRMADYYKLIILPEAQQDIRDIVLYIAQELFAPKAALNLQDDFHEEIQKLSYMPTRIKPIDEEPWGSRFLDLPIALEIQPSTDS